MSNDAAGFTRVTDRSVASPNGAFDAGLRPAPFPDRAASLLPGLLAATRTGLTPAGDDELMLDQLINKHPPTLGALWRAHNSAIAGGRHPALDAATAAVAKEWRAARNAGDCSP